MPIDKPSSKSQTPPSKSQTPQPQLDDLLSAIESQVRENPALRAVDSAVEDYRNTLGPIRANLEELNSGNYKTEERKTFLIQELSDQLELLRNKQLAVEDKIREGRVSKDQLLPTKLKELIKLSDTLATMKRNIEGLEMTIIKSSKK